MEEVKAEPLETASSPDLRGLIREALREMAAAQEAKSPDLAKEVETERQRRTELEKRVAELTEENRRSKASAEQADRQQAIRGELQRLGVTKVDLAFRAIKDDIVRSESGELVANGDGEEISMSEYLRRFVRENPELLPSRLAGGSGASGADRGSVAPDLNTIRPGMSAEDLERVRQEISRLAASEVIRRV